MSGTFQGANTTEGGIGFAEYALPVALGSMLTRIMMAEAIMPGSPPSYELCKLIFAFHPLGAKMAEAPINMAQSQEREITVDAPGEDRLLAAFRREWRAIGGIGSDGSWTTGDDIIKNVKVQSRIYGIASLVMGDRRDPADVDKPIDWERLHEAEPYFSVLDPLITAGSLILNQDPHSPDFQKPRVVRAGGRAYHPSRSLVVINEMPLYIQWSDPAFGFSGRSVYQRALFPLKTFLQSLITDAAVTKKAALLIHKAKAPGSVQNQKGLNFFGLKRSQLKSGMTGEVVTIGIDETIESINFQNLEGPAAFARNNSLKNVAMAASMPAKLLEQEELVEGLAEGTEDAKQIARFIDRMRLEMNPLYAFMDRVVQRRAWSPAFYKTMQKDLPDVYRKMDYTTAFYGWVNKFEAEWPNLLAEPESKQIETEKVRFEAVVALIEVLAPLIKAGENRAALLDWAADEVSSKRKLFASSLTLDTDAEAKVEDQMPMTPREAEEIEPRIEPFRGTT